MQVKSMKQRSMPRAFSIAVALFLLMSAAAPDTLGQETKEQKTKTEIQDIKTEIPETWMAKLPEPKEFDWILLTSGEWLKGEIQVLSEDSFEFDRSKLLAIIPGEPTERNYWDGLLTLGMTARSGNTDTMESNI